MRTTVMCGWCHAGTTAAYCPECGHRAGVARLDCDCPRCVFLGRPFDLPDDAHESALRTAMRRLREYE
jgi:hypothetical protein